MRSPHLTSEQNSLAVPHRGLAELGVRPVPVAVDFLEALAPAPELQSRAPEIIIQTESRLIAKRLEGTIAWLTSDPTLAKTYQSLQDSPSLRFQFKPVPSLKALGAKSDQDDCALAVIEIPPSGSFRYELYFEPKLLVSLGRAVVAIHHEFYHVTRDEARVTFQDFNREEFETYNLSTRGLRRVIEEATLLQDSIRSPQLADFISELSAGYEADRQALSKFKKSLR